MATTRRTRRGLPDAAELATADHRPGSRQPARLKTQRVETVSNRPSYRVVVLEVTDVVERVRPHLPNVYVGVTTRTAQQLADGLNNGRYRPSWARHNIAQIRADLVTDDTVTFDEAIEQRDTLIRQLRTNGYTVNRNTTAYRTYVINLHNPKLKEPGKGYVYVGQTSKSPEQRLQEHLTGAISTKGHNLASRVVRKFGVDLNYGLMTQKIYLTKKQAEKAERRLAERLRTQGYLVEGGR